MFFKIKRRLIDAVVDEEMFQENWTLARILQMYVVLPRFSEAFYKYKMTQLAKFRKIKSFSFKAKFQVFCTMLIFAAKKYATPLFKNFHSLGTLFKIVKFSRSKMRMRHIFKNL